ncbi:MAG: hypothetical protein Q8L56_00750 [Rhodocyclaceae bacterium]|nr:hypothetical protein [Rhodocyclaceae bacterium]
MSRHHPKKRPPFITLPRHRRSDKVIRLKGEIRRDADLYGGRFTSHHVLNEPGRPDLYNQWADFYFVGSNRFTIWNAEIVTARRAFWDAAHNLAYDRADALRAQEERDADSKLEFEPASRSRTGRVLTYRLVEREPVRYEQFGGLTLSEQWEKLESEIVLNEPPTIYESFNLDRGYAYGIGLRIVLDVDVINQSTIELAIDKFLATGEADWQSPHPVPRERLPDESEKEALAALNYPSVLLGMPIR